MWSILLTIVAFFIIRFLWDYFRQNQEVARQGGMANKYQELIRLTCGGNPTMKVRQVTSNSISYVGKNPIGTLFFNLTQSFGKVNVEWGTDNPMLGRHSLQWVFGEFEDQKHMYDQMVADIKKENQRS